MPITNSKLKEKKIKHKAVEDLTEACPIVPLLSRSNLAGRSLQSCKKIMSKSELLYKEIIFKAAGFLETLG